MHKILFCPNLYGLAVLRVNVCAVDVLVSANLYVVGFLGLQFLDGNLSGCCGLCQLILRTLFLELVVYLVSGYTGGLSVGYGRLLLSGFCFYLGNFRRFNCGDVDFLAGLLVHCKGLAVAVVAVSTVGPAIQPSLYRDAS